MAVKAHAIVAAERIPFHHVWPGVERRRREPLLVDIGDPAHHPAISDAQQMQILGVLAIGVEQRHGVERRAIMVDLPLDPRIFAAVEEVPIAAGIAVIAPARDRRIIAQDHLLGDVGLWLVPEIAHPCIDFGLAGRIPRHLRSEREFERAPVIGALLHQPLHLGGFGGQALALEVLEDVDEHVALHQPELGIIGRIAHHRDGGDVRLVEIPAPVMGLDQPGMVARGAIEHPMADRDVRIVIGTAKVVRVLLLPRGPRLPFVGILVEVGELDRIVVEQALLDRACLRAIGDLEVADHGLAHHALELRDFGRIGIVELFHHRRDPRTAAALVAHPRDPDPRVLIDDLLRFVVIGEDRGRAAERVAPAFEPLFRRREAAEIGHGLLKRLGDKIAYRLHLPVGISEGEAHLTPLLAAHVELRPALLVARRRRLDRTSREALDLADRGRRLDEQGRSLVRRDDIAGNAHRDRTLAGHQRLLDRSDRRRLCHPHADFDRLAGGEGAAGGCVPLLAGILPLAVGIADAVDGPVVKAFGGLAALALVGEDRALGLPRVLERGIGLERAPLFGEHQQCRPLAVEPRDLQITGVAADIGIDEACLGMRLIEIAIADDVVEHHRHAECADLERRCRRVGDAEAQPEQPRLVDPATLDLERRIGTHARGDVRRGDHLAAFRKQPDRLACVCRGEVAPFAAGCADAQIEIAGMVVAVARSLGLARRRHEAECGLGGGREPRERLGVAAQTDFEAAHLVGSRMDRRIDRLGLLLRHQCRNTDGGRDAREQQGRGAKETGSAHDVSHFVVAPIAGMAGAGAGSANTGGFSSSRCRVK